MSSLDTHGIVVKKSIFLPRSRITTRQLETTKEMLRVRGFEPLEVEVPTHLIVFGIHTQHPLCSSTHLRDLMDVPSEYLVGVVFVDNADTNIRSEMLKGVWPSRNFVLVHAEKITSYAEQYTRDLKSIPSFTTTQPMHISILNFNVLKRDRDIRYYACSEPEISQVIQAVGSNDVKPSARFALIPKFMPIDPVVQFHGWPHGTLVAVCRPQGNVERLIPWSEKKVWSIEYRRV